MLPYTMELAGKTESGASATASPAKVESGASNENGQLAGPYNPYNNGYNENGNGGDQFSGYGQDGNGVGGGHRFSGF